MARMSPLPVLFTIDGLHRDAYDRFENMCILSRKRHSPAGRSRGQMMEYGDFIVGESGGSNG